MVPNLVSTVIPVYNRPEMLREAVASVLAQSHRPIEVIIVDDGSTDDTPRVAEELVRTHPGEIVFLRKSNSGPGPSREMGRQAARGEFLQYLDSDDLLRPRKFELQVQALRDQPESGAAYGWICVHPVGRSPLEKPFKGSGDRREFLFPRILADRWWNTDCPIWRRSVCDAIGPWSDLKWSQDWEYDARAGALGTKLAFVADWVCDERHHGQARQTSAANWLDPLRLRERLRFLQMIFSHAERAGVTADEPDRIHFTRWVFATARNCAAAGLPSETRACLDLADRAAGDNRAARRGFRAFKWLSATVGYRAAGQLALWGQRWKRPSSSTLTQSFAESLQK
jgi:glycosyltransferase involved in cell wall biosynthesis